MKHPTEKEVRVVHEKAKAVKDFGTIASIESLYPELGTHIEYYPESIYASKPHGLVYKLQKVDKRWMFCQIGSSEWGSNGSHPTAEKAIKVESGNAEIKVFDNQKDFLKWALSQIK